MRDQRQDLIFISLLVHTGTKSNSVCLNRTADVTLLVNKDTFENRRPI